MSAYAAHHLIKRIAFFGDAKIPKTDPVYQDAFNTARLLAQEGYAIVNGGGPGVMDASTQGCESVGGETIAVTFSPKETSSFEGRYIANLDRVDKEVVTQNYIDRMFKLLEYGDLFIIFKGGSGTLSEFGTAWVLANIYYGHHKPFILFGDFWWEIVSVLHKSMLIDEQEMDTFVIVESPERALEAVKQFAWKLEQIDHSRCKMCKEKAFMT
jgi:uncharacterized protein (TIGR00725 family)